MRMRSAVPTATAFALAFCVGWFDVGAKEVQGPLLLFCVIVFVMALVSRSSPAIIAVATTVGLPLAHGLSLALGRGGDPRWSMLFILPIMLGGAYAGRGAGRLIEEASGSLRDDTVPHNARNAPLLALALTAAMGAGILPVYAVNVMRHQPFAWWLTIIWQILTFLAWIALTPTILRRWRSTLHRETPQVEIASLATHAGVVLALALADAILLPLMTRALFIPLGDGGVGNAMLWAFAAYLPLDALVYTLLIALGYAADAERRLRATTDREAAVRGELATSRLASLRAQLKPHFLFNALNAASVLARRGDSEKAGNVLARLSDLLRYVLRAPAEGLDDAATLDEELAFAAAYLDIERERFAERLEYSIDAAPELRKLSIPHLLLQPLVENAVLHGISNRLSGGTIAIRAWMAGESLAVAVDDDGDGRRDDSAASGTGIGLANTRSRLATLFGNRARLDLVRREHGGTRAQVVLPLSQ